MMLKTMKIFYIKNKKGKLNYKIIVMILLMMMNIEKLVVLEHYLKN